MMKPSHSRPTRNIPMRKKNPKTSGFTLIELMIAITIGLFMIAGMIAIVISMKGSFNTQGQLSNVQDSQRFSLTVLDNTIRTAGYFPNPTSILSAAALPATSTANPDGTTFAAAQGIVGTTGTSPASDTINVRFQSASGDGLMDCQGDTNTSGSSVIWTNSFAINAANQLTCVVSVNGGTPGTPSVLVDNVASISVLYGVNTINKVNSVDTYLPASAVANWAQVMSTQITITFLDLVNATPTKAPTLPPLVHTISLMSNT
ncbi:PilW family protein [Glaciimonas soli]|uniref:Prepilin-type N-terminal cleavage/methylation domain-containing protein n=1 Tax=Glaciimonas soli TaxID=2590999 RepID=A0A843YQN0_9BURK|nr:PilW family protein [Glaciimonas soli]MQQ99797.1 prepilin-type N-terminal cleavage/methylation domain-containing protein [Glaciimonas soli]